jgi:hypothetical protein
VLGGHHASVAQAATDGYGRALLTGTGLLLAAMLVALLARNARRSPGEEALEPVTDPA